MILLKRILLVFFGLYISGIVAAGVYVFLAIIGVFVHLMGKTNARKHIILCETVTVLGGVLGGVVNIYEFPIYMRSSIGTIFLAVAGVCVGIFVEHPVMLLVEMLKALPVISRGIRLTVGLQYLISALVTGKFTGSLIYFWSRMASMG